MTDSFIQNGDVRLHTLRDGDDDDLVPLLIVPGLSESADDYAGLIDALAPRRCVAVTLRGRGRSDVPVSGYGLGDHVGDVTAAASLLGDRRFCLYAFSRGVTYGLGYAVANPSRLAGLIVGDYPAYHSALPAEFPERFLATSWRGTPAPERIAADAVRAIQRESHEEALWDRLPALDCPALVLHGSAAKGSALSDAQIDKYRRALRQVTVTALPESGHDLLSPDPAPFVATVRSFLEALDSR